MHTIYGASAVERVGIDPWGHTGKLPGVDPRTVGSSPQPPAIQTL